jgi:hypothetical protein
MLKDRHSSESDEGQFYIMRMAVLNGFPKVATRVLQDTDTSQPPVWQTD